MRRALVRAVLAASGTLAAAAAFATPESAAPDSTASAAVRAAAPLAADSLAARAFAETLEVRRVLVTAGEGPGHVRRPSGVAVDAFGRLWTTDEAEHRLQRFDAEGRAIAEAGALGSDPGQLRRPVGVALHGSAGLAVLDLENRRIVAYDLFARRSGDLVDFAALERDDPLGRIEPNAFAADRGGALYVVDPDRDRIVTFDAGGAATGTLGGFGTRPGAFRGLAGLAIGARGEIVAAERGNARVQVLDAGGRVLRAWPLDVRPGRESLAVATDAGGRVAVADEAAGAVWLFAADGAPIAVARGLDGPAALAFARSGGLIVCERRGGRIVELAARDAR